jgi:hypothetical protein
MSDTLLCVSRPIVQYKHRMCESLSAARLLGRCDDGVNDDDGVSECVMVAVSSESDEKLILLATNDNKHTH